MNHMGIMSLKMLRSVLFAHTGCAGELLALESPVFKNYERAFSS